MPTSDRLFALLPFLCAILLGISVAIVVYLLVRRLKLSSVPVAAVIGDAQRRLRRESLTAQSSLSKSVLAILPAFTVITRRLPVDSFRESLRSRYAEAGWPGGLDDEEVLALSFLVGLVLTVPFLLILLMLKPLAAPFALVFLLAGPSLVSAQLSTAGVERAKSISRTMPYVLDLLTLTMRAGASMPIAIDRVGSDFQGQAVGTEFRAILTDLEMGVTLRQAYENLAKRAPLPVVRQFTDDVIQSEELGRPIAETLERLSDAVRVRRVQEATETAGKAKVMVLVPGMLVFAATLELLFAPFIVRYWYEGLNIG